jgi:polyhydroxyalkanoate synthesis regulator phasin
MTFMAPTDPWKRYLDAGFELTQLTRQRAEKVVRDLMKAGEVQREEAQDRVEELLDRSRRTTEAVVELVRDEVAKQLRAIGITTGRAKKATAQATGTAKKATAKATGTAKKATKKAAGTAKKATKKATGAS